MRTRQRLLRALVTDIIADVDEAVREVVPTIHWRAASTRNLRVRKAEDAASTAAARPRKALAVMRSHGKPAGRTRTSLHRSNRMGMPHRPRQDLDSAPVSARCGG